MLYYTQTKQCLEVISVFDIVQTDYTTGAPLGVEIQVELYVCSYLRECHNREIVPNWYNNAMTEYIVAQTSQDYKSCHELIKLENVDDTQLTFPTLMAYNKDDDLVGLLGTHISKGHVCAGPLVLRSDRARYWTIIRLVDTYDKVMSEMGLSYYIISVEQSNKEWIDKVENLVGLKPYSTDENHRFYVRRL